MYKLLHFAAKLTHNLQFQENLVKKVFNVLAISYYQYLTSFLIIFSINLVKRL
jgi:hypothetical protein